MAVELNDTTGNTWSETDASNTAAAPDGAPAGTVPSAAEGIWRGTMATVKRFWNRINGKITTTGASTHYIYTPANTSYPTAYSKGEVFTWWAHQDSAGSDDFNLNSLGVKSLKKFTASGKVVIAAGDIKNGMRIVSTYDGTDMIVENPVSSGGVTSVNVVDATNGGLNFTGGPVTSSGSITGNIAPGDLTSKGTPVGADLVLIGDSAASNAAKTSTITAVLALVSAIPSGSVMPFAARVVPSGWLICDGSAVSRSTFASLFAAMCPSLGTFSVTIASPAVFTLASHGLSVGERVRFTTTGALPTGLTVNTDYFVSVVPSANTFNVSATAGGSNVNTTGSQSGTHTAQFFAYGAGDGSTTFNVPDLRGRAIHGADAMGGTAASRVTRAVAGIDGAALGGSGGDQHTQSHSLSFSATFGDTSAGGGYTGPGGAAGVAGPIGSFSTGSATDGTGSSQNMPPAIITNYIIKN